MYIVSEFKIRSTDAILKRVSDDLYCEETFGKGALSQEDLLSGDPERTGYYNPDDIEVYSVENTETGEIIPVGGHVKSINKSVTEVCQVLGFRFADTNCHVCLHNGLYWAWMPLDYFRLTPSPVFKTFDQEDIFDIEEKLLWVINNQFVYKMSVESCRELIAKEPNTYKIFKHKENMDLYLNNIKAIHDYATQNWHNVLEILRGIDIQNNSIKTE